MLDDEVTPGMIFQAVHENRPEGIAWLASLTARQAPAAMAYPLYLRERIARDERLPITCVRH